PLAVGPEVSRMLAGDIRRGFAARDDGCAPPEQFLDVWYGQLMDDPLAVVRRIYRHFDLPLSTDVESRMRTFLATHPKGRNGLHVYSLGQFGFDPAVERPALRTVVSARWIAESINQLLPALHVGGNVVRARRLARAGMPGPLAGASVVVDITLHLFAQMLFTMLGLSLLLVSVRGAGINGSAIAGLVLSAVGAAGFYLMQRRGLFATLAALLRGVVRSDDWSPLIDGAGAMDVWVRHLYRHPRALAVAEIWHVLSWLLGAGETWLALRFLGHPVELTTALVIESLGEGIRTAAFPVPAALGVQEGGFVLLGGLFGLTPSVSVALSLA